MQSSNTDNELMQVASFLDRVLGHEEVKALALLQSITELKELMQEEIVHFVFNKTDGTLRHAYGTRAVEVIRRYDQGHTSSSKRQQKGFTGTFPYFDIEKKDWRCFRVDNLVTIDMDYTI